MITALQRSGSRRLVPALVAGALNSPRLRRTAHRLLSTPARCALRHTALDFDRRHGVDTDGRVGSPAEPVWYEPTSPRHFAFAMRFVPPPLARWSLLDVGSGKGRVVLLAMRHPFRRVVGVEFDPDLHAVAEANVRRFPGPRRCGAVELVCADATTLPLPPGDVVVFFYNSFRGALLARYLDHLEASLRETPRRLVLVYSNPTERAAVDARPAFSPVFAGVSPRDWVEWGNRKLVVYRTDPDQVAWPRPGRASGPAGGGQ